MESSSRSQPLFSFSASNFTKTPEQGGMDKESKALLTGQPNTGPLTASCSVGNSYKSTVFVPLRASLRAPPWALLWALLSPLLSPLLSGRLLSGPAPLWPCSSLASWSNWPDWSTGLCRKRPWPTQTDKPLPITTERA
ncbi:hypothetical protein CDD82_1285 [Ophiocordyceps australis]|uniref:Uncharacterized protein n=1 Tax=Ophiocordyceps australis TaxID=1399860 RepID=A0A2C5ZMW7_9HYPO|nr:hypothetical protein CDD82_1285 [Ophiocordyceps australis]